jgi:phage terminase large subunit-like protein
MYPFQEKLIKNFHDNRFNICKMPRQTGKSTTCVSYLLHYAVFNDNVNIAILANKASTARDLLGKITTCIRKLA